MESKEVILELRATFEEELTNDQTVDTCDAIVDSVEGENIGFVGLVTCKMSLAGSGGRRLLAVSYDIVITINVPITEEVSGVATVSSLIAAIETIPELKGATVAVVAFTEDGREVEIPDDLPSAAGTAAPSQLTMLCALVFVLRRS